MRTSFLLAGLFLTGLLLSACAAPQQRSPAAQLLEARRFDDAVVAYQAEVRANPRDTQARQGYDAARRAAAAEHQLRARQAEQEHRLGDALTELERAVGLDPALEAARFELSRLQREHRLLQRTLHEAQRRVQQGDCLTAKELLDGLSRHTATFPTVPTLREQAMRQCFDRDLALARLFLDLHNHDQALRFLDEAEPYFPGHPDVAALRLRAEQGQACQQGILLGAELLSQGNPAAAALELGRVIDRCPAETQVRRAWEATRHKGLAVSLQEGERAVRSSSNFAALVAFETALGLGIEDAALQAQVQQLALAYRKIVATQLYATAESNLASGLAGAAMIRFRLAHRLAPELTEAQTRAQQAEQQAAEAMRLTVAVLPPTNPGNFPWLGKELGTELGQALRTELAAHPGIEITEGYQGLPEVVLSGKLDEFLVEAPPPVHEPRAIPYTVASKRLTNPAFLDALTRVVQARRLVRDHAGDARAQEAAAAAQQALLATPPAIDQPVQATLELPVAKLAITGRSRLQLKLVERESGTTLAELGPQAFYRTEESIWQGFPPAGVQPHRGTLPTAESVRRRLLLDLVEQSKAKLALAVREWQARRLSLLAGQSKADEAIHYWALLLLSGGDGARAAQQKLRELVGYPGDQGYDVRRLSF